MGHAKKLRRQATSAPARGRRILPILAGTALAISLVAVGASWWDNARQADPLTMYQKLQGRWQRSDGGYIIDIRGVDAAGTLTAVYLNPRPIHVEKAAASMVGDTLSVLIELRDVNYPGSTYRLRYDPAADRLKGVYYQAMLRESYDVEFARLTP